jgi:uncharacterized protein YwqG
MSISPKEEALNNKDPKHRAEALKNLMWNEIPQLTPKLLSMLSTETNKDVLMAIAYAFSGNPDLAVLEQIAGFFSHPSPIVRLAAVKSIADTSAPAIFKDLLPLLKDENTEVRQAVVWKISYFEKKPDLLLIKSVLDDSSFPVEALALLQYVSSKEALKYSHRIKAVLADSNSPALGSVIQIIGNLRLSEFAKDIVRYLSDKEIDSDVIQALEKLDAKEFLPDIEKLANTTDSGLAKDLAKKWGRENKPKKAVQKSSNPFDGLKKAGFKDLADKIKKLAKPSLSLTLTAEDDDKIPVGASKLGGLPDLLPTDAWPSGSSGPMAFLAQINLSDIRSLQKGILAPNGTISFFCDMDNYLDGGREVLKVIFTTKKADKLQRRPFPDGLSHQLPSCLVKLEKVSSYPSPQSDIVQEQLTSNSEEEEAYRNFLADVNQSETDEDHRMFGYPIIINAGDVGGTGITMLLQLSSSNLAQLNWASGGRIYILIETGALNMNRFEEAELHFRST